MLSSNYNAIYIDTEGNFRPERIQEIANARGLHPKQILQKILVAKALDIWFSQVWSDSDNKIKLLIVDSIIYHYRTECAGCSKLPEKIQRLNKYMHLLLKTAHTNAIIVVVTNHETQSSVDKTYNIVPLGGNAISYASKYRIHLAYQGRYRRARLDLGPCPPQDDIFFAINERGFTDIVDEVISSGQPGKPERQYHGSGIWYATNRTRFEKRWPWHIKELESVFLFRS